MPEVKLTKLQKDVLVFIGQDSFGKNFYWTGGTLLSYFYLRHRDSVDLDFFSENLFADDEYLMFLNRLKKIIKANKINLTIQFNRRLCLVERGDQVVKLELVYFPFAAIETRKKLPGFSLLTDSLTDLMVNKTLSAYQRNEPKDAYDLYCYLSDNPKQNLQSLIKLAEKKFGVAIEPLLLLAKLNELAGNLNSLQPLLLRPHKNLTIEVKNFFQKIFNSTIKL
ncbi:MAG: nucleotidyl transferase AbiEii/AbiGii toxin family protein [bacterium]